MPSASVLIFAFYQISPFTLFSILLYFLCYAWVNQVPLSGSLADLMLYIFCNSLTFIALPEETFNWGLLSRTAGTFIIFVFDFGSWCFTLILKMNTSVIVSEGVSNLSHLGILFLIKKVYFFPIENFDLLTTLPLPI